MAQTTKKKTAMKPVTRAKRKGSPRPKKTKASSTDIMPAVISNQDIQAILRNELRDPFDVLGMHSENNGLSVRACLPRAARAVVHMRGGEAVQEMMRVADEGVFVALIPGRSEFFKYEIRVTTHEGNTETLVDPYSFLPIMSEESRYLYNEGNHHYIYNDLGSHIREIEGVRGTVFAVWAPNAKRVSVVGDFNGWDGRRGPMRLLGSSGVWELFVPGVDKGAIYKYEIKKHDRDHLMLKSDPLSYYQEPFPNHGSIVFDLDEFEWEDSEWLSRRAGTNPLHEPMNVYEVHLGSWRRTGDSEDSDYLSYEELAHQLAEYVTELGYTHVELMPVQEHPFVPSWGYQVTGFYATNHRFGDPKGFQYLVNYLHKRGIGVILDWVAGHFPRDAHGLALFDGSHLYEHQNPKEGEHKDWGTLIFNYGRHEVRNFLTANAVFWLEKFHVDGLRVDAVASMLYRNYSREDGEWVPNKFGGVENLEAVDFLRTMNELVHEKFPGAMTVAEESTAWPMVSRPTYLGGLGFTFKWNMGWMHDILAYFSKDPIHRRYHHQQLTFGLWYAFTENFVLVLSHDEVVHGKRSLLEKMAGDVWQKYANLRALYGFMLGHPGKKMLFMGGEFGMHNEWYSKRSIDWHVLSDDHDAYHHQGLLKMVADINHLYAESPALFEVDFENAGFTWVDCGDSENSIISFTRHAKNDDSLFLFVCNFTPVVRYDYRVGVPRAGYYNEVLNTDANDYGGAGYGNQGGSYSAELPWHGHPHSACLTLPPLSTLAFRWQCEG